MGPNRATVVHMESLEAILAVKAAYDFARQAIANDGYIDCTEAERLLVLLETACGEALDAKLAAKELDHDMGAVEAILRNPNRGHSYSPYMQKKLAAANLKPIRDEMNVTELYPNGPRPDGSRAA